MRGLGRKARGRNDGSGSGSSAAGAPPPPPPFAVPAAAVAAEGPTTFAFPEPHPDENALPRARTDRNPTQSVDPKSIVATIVAIAVAVAAHIVRGGDSSPYGMGRSLGIAMTGFLLAYGARRLYLQRSTGGGPAWTLSMVPVALAVGLVGQFVLLGTALPAPGKDEVRATLVPLEGFEYQAAPAAAVEQIEGFLSDLPEIGDEIGAVEARLLHRGTQPAGVVMVLGIQPDALRDMDTAEFRAGLQATSGGQVAEKKRGKVKTFELDMGPLYAVMFLDDDGYIFSVQGFQKRDAVAVAKRLAVANL